VRTKLASAAWLSCSSAAVLVWVSVVRQRPVDGLPAYDERRRERRDGGGGGGGIDIPGDRVAESNAEASMIGAIRAACVGVEIRQADLA
jgi:hypothetical protein